jgi:transcriptional regulator with GAF, ATPase, and Fis domain
MQKIERSSLMGKMPELQSQFNSSQSEAVVTNRLEALKVLSNSLLYEIEALQINENPTANRKIDLATEVQRFEMDLIRSALVRTGGKQRPAARLLNVKVTTLNAKIKRYGIEPGDLRKSF